jgi:hypothetical protein
MGGFVNDLLMHCNIQGTANTPATSSLFSVALSEEIIISLYHSKITLFFKKNQT